MNTKQMLVQILLGAMALTYGGFSHGACKVGEQLAGYKAYQWNRYYSEWQEISSQTYKTNAACNTRLEIHQEEFPNTETKCSQVCTQGRPTAWERCQMTGAAEICADQRGNVQGAALNYKFNCKTGQMTFCQGCMGGRVGTKPICNYNPSTPYCGKIKGYCVSKGAGGSLSTVSTSGLNPSKGLCDLSGTYHPCSKGCFVEAPGTPDYCY